MSAQQQSRPVITPPMREQAKQQPNSWLYVVDPIFTDPTAEIPPWGFIGGYRVDERGELTDDYSPNPNYRPSPVALRMRAPTNDVERALQLAITGYAQGDALLTGLLDAELVLFAQPQFADQPGSGLFMMDHESGRKQLQVFTSDGYLPPGWTSWQRLTGRQLLDSLTGVDVQVNPNSPTKARVPGEDLIRAAGRSPATAGEAAPEDGSTPTSAAPTSENGADPTSENPAAPASENPAAPTSENPAAPASENAADLETDHSAPEPAPAAPAPHAPDKPEVTQQETPADPETNDAPGVDERFLGSVLAGAVGDALGAPVEYYPLEQIRSRFGTSGVTDFDSDTDPPGQVTDATQLTLFTLEGLIRGHRAVRCGVSSSPLPAVHHAYQRWLHTQGVPWSQAVGVFARHHPEPDGWLVTTGELFDSRSPGSACLSALRGFAAGNPPGSLSHRVNDSAACEGLVRVAPVALWSQDSSEVFEVAAATAALTHGHPNAYLSAGTLAVIVHRLLHAEALADAVGQAAVVLAHYPEHEELSRQLQVAVDLAGHSGTQGGAPDPETLKNRLGVGWTAAEALPIAVCAALSTATLPDALITAVNHSGASDTTAAICGSIVGAHYGASAVPSQWRSGLELGATVETLARDALSEFGPEPPALDEWAERYPCRHETFGRHRTPAGQSDEIAVSAPADAAVSTQSPDAHETSATASDATSEPVRSAPDTAHEPAQDEEWLHRDPVGDAPEADTINAAQVGATEVDAGQVDPAEVDTSRADAPEVGAPMADTVPADTPGSSTTDLPVDGSAPGKSTAHEADAPSRTPPPAADTVDGEPGADAVVDPPRTTDPVAGNPSSAPAPQDPPSATPGALADDEQAMLAAWRTLRSGATPDSGALAELGALVREALPASDAARLLASPEHDAASAPEPAERVAGSVLGGAVGDSLGAGVLFHTWDDIEREHGPDGITEPAAFAGRRGAITANTQTDLFVAHALLHPPETAHSPLVHAVRDGLREWMHTQRARPAGDTPPSGVLERVPELYAQRFPDHTTMIALATRPHDEPLPTVDNPVNVHSGYGALTRSGALGLLPGTSSEAFVLGVRAAALTHGHADGYLPAGAFAALVRSTLNGTFPQEALETVLTELPSWQGHHPTSRSLEAAAELAGQGTPGPRDLATLGTGWEAPHALAIGTSAVLAGPETFHTAVACAANHGGNSAATAAVAGRLAGAVHGRRALPAAWLTDLELRETLEAVAAAWTAHE